MRQNTDSMEEMLSLLKQLGRWKKKTDPESHPAGQV